MDYRDIVVIRHNGCSIVDKSVNRKVIAFKIPSKSMPSSLSENEAAIYVL